MPKFTEHHAQELVKALIVGDSGGGKSGALPTIINEKQVERMCILDFDNGLDVMHQFLLPEFREHVYFETLTDMMKTRPDGGSPFAPNPNALSRGLRLLDHWKTDEYDLGKPTDWGPETCLVIDSFTMLGQAALHQVKKVNNAVMDRDWGWYGPAMEIEEHLLELLCSDAISCNVIVTAHIVPITPKKTIESTTASGKPTTKSIDIGDPKNYPSALGNKLPPKVGRYFNAVLRVRSKGYGAGLKRTIETVSDEDIELKNPAPLSVPQSIPLDGPAGGLGEYFRIVRAVARGDTTSE